MVFLVEYKDVVKIFPQKILVWHEIAVFYIYRGLIFLLSITNLIVAIFLALLVFLNIAVSIYSYSLSKVCQFRPGFKGLYLVSRCHTVLLR